MAYNDIIIEKLREAFNKDESDRFTNCALVFAYNGTGKTRLSYDFAHYGRTEGSPQHTLYYNAYTEDLFTWDNHIEDETEDREHHLLINTDSSLIQGLAGYDFADKLREYFHVFTDIDFDFHYNDNNAKIPEYATFNKADAENIKISRGEERLFVWCFFRCILDQVIGGNDAYKDIEYIYIDDPMSSLDDNNVIAFAQQLYNVIRQQLRQEVNAQRAGKVGFRRIKFVVSSHHALFYHVMLRGLSKDNKLGRYYLHRDKQTDDLVLKSMGDTEETPFYYNVAIMSEIQNAIKNDRLYTYHFTVMRSVMEKITEFFGHFDYRYILDGITYKENRFDESSFSKGDLTDLYSRMVNVFSHQGAFFSPLEMNEDNKALLKTLFYHIKNKYHFLLPELNDERSEKEINSPQNNRNKNNIQTWKRSNRHS